MEKPKEYHIESLEQLVNLCTEVDTNALAIDLAKWLLVTAETYKAIRRGLPHETKELTNWQVAKIEFIWIDDGKHDLLDTRVTNPATGETFTVERKNEGK